MARGGRRGWLAGVEVVLILPLSLGSPSELTVGPNPSSIEAARDRLEPVSGARTSLSVCVAALTVLSAVVVVVVEVVVVGAGVVVVVVWSVWWWWWRERLWLSCCCRRRMVRSLSSSCCCRSTTCLRRSTFSWHTCAGVMASFSPLRPGDSLLARLKYSEFLRLASKGLMVSAACNILLSLNSIVFRAVTSWYM